MIELNDAVHDLHQHDFHVMFHRSIQYELILRHASHYDKLEVLSVRQNDLHHVCEYQDSSLDDVVFASIELYIRHLFWIQVFVGDEILIQLVFEGLLVHLQVYWPNWEEHCLHVLRQKVLPKLHVLLTHIPSYR